METTRRIGGRIVLTAAMLAVVCALCAVRWAQAHLVYTACLLSGMLLGPLWGGAAAGLGAGLYAVLTSGDWLSSVLVLVSGFAMAFVCGLMMEKDAEKRTYLRTLEAAAMGMLCGVGLHLLLTCLVYDAVDGTGWARALDGLHNRLLNMAMAFAAAGMLYHLILTLKNRKWRWRTALFWAAAAAVSFGLAAWRGPQNALTFTACLLGGLLLGPMGGVSAGLGAMLGALLGGADLSQLLVTLAADGSMGLVCGLIKDQFAPRRNYYRSLLASFAGAVSGAWMYLAMIVFSGDAENGAGWARMTAGLPGDALIHAAIALAAAPVLLHVGLTLRKIQWQWKTAAYTAAYTVVLAVAVCVLSALRVPLLGHEMHFAWAVCLLGGLLLGPVPGGLAAGLGGALYAVWSGGALPAALPAFFSMFAVGFVSGLLAEAYETVQTPGRVREGSVMSALTWGLTAGVGFTLYAALLGAALPKALIVFFSMFALGFVCGLLMDENEGWRKYGRLVEASAVAALNGALLYLLLSLVWGQSADSLLTVLLTAAVAVAAAPVFLCCGGSAVSESVQGKPVNG